MKKKIIFGLLLLMSSTILIPSKLAFAEEQNLYVINMNSNVGNETQIKVGTLAVQIKTIYHTVTINASDTAHIPDYYWYNDGQWRGNLKLQSWQDYREHPQIHGFICTYKGTVSNSGAPANKNILENC